MDQQALQEYEFTLQTLRCRGLKGMGFTKKLQSMVQLPLAFRGNAVGPDDHRSFASIGYLIKDLHPPLLQEVQDLRRRGGSSDELLHAWVALDLHRERVSSAAIHQSHEFASDSPQTPRRRDT